MGMKLTHLWLSLCPRARDTSQLWILASIVTDSYQSRLDLGMLQRGSAMPTLPLNFVPIAVRTQAWKHVLTHTVALVVASGTLLAGMPARANSTLLAQTQRTEPSQTETTISTPPPDARFTCEYESGQYTVMYHPQSQPGQSYAWATPRALGGGWTEDRRCYEISRRLEFYRPDGLLEMQTSVENGYDIVCVTTEANPSCRIVLTVPPGQDPIITRDRVFGNLITADSGQQTQGVNTFADERGGNLLNQLGDAIGVDLSSLTGRSRRSTTSYSPGAIDLRPFLDPADGGTGTQL